MSRALEATACDSSFGGLLCSMATIRGIRERIAGIRHMAQLTKAMEMVAISRVKFFHEQVQSVRPYTLRAWDIISHLIGAEDQDEFVHPLLGRRGIRAVGLLAIGANRGLCGSFQNDQVRLVEDFIRLQSVPVRIVTVGRKMQAWAAKTGQDLIAEFSQFPPQPTLDDAGPIARVLMDLYMEGAADLVYIAGTRFLSISRQRPGTWQVLPVVVVERAPIRTVQYINEPDVSTIMDEILPRFIQLQVYDAILESTASEYSARRMAMHKAHLNASDLIGDLSLLYNKRRQRTITDEILEVVSGVSALALGDSQ